MESVQSDRKDFVWPNSVVETSTGVFVANTNIQTTDAIMGLWQHEYNDIKENYVKDASAFKIREIALNYTLPSNLTEKTKVFQKITVGVIARNLLTIFPNEKYIFSDPEFKNAGTGSNIVGVGGYTTSPPTQSFGFNVNIEF